MGMQARIGRAAFHEACVVHFREPVQKALSIVAQPPLTEETFPEKSHQALKELLDPAKVPQEVANLLRAARGEIDATHLRDKFDWKLVQQAVYLSEAYAKRLELTEDQHECIGRFLQILRIAADRPDEEEDEEGQHPDIALAAYRPDEEEGQYPDIDLITAARAAYKTFPGTVVARGVPEVEATRAMAERQQQTDHRQRIRR